MNTFIYVLLENNIPFYIGKTNNLIRRINHHKWRLNNHNIEIIELDQVLLNEWKFWEKHYISLYKSWGFKLVNKNEGGGGLTKHNQNSIEKSREKRRGQKRPSTSIKLKGKLISNETKRKISLSNSKPKPIGFGDKISKIKTGQKQTEESNLKRRKSHLGISKPEVSKKNKGRISPNKGKIGKKRNNVFLNNLSLLKSHPINQYDLQGNFIKEWESVTKASESLQKPKGMGAISECCNNKRKTAYKFIWKNKILK